MQILAGRGGGEELGGAGGGNYNHSILYGENLLKIKDSSYTPHVVANAWNSALGRLKQMKSCQCKVHSGNIVKAIHKKTCTWHASSSVRCCSLWQLRFIRVDSGKGPSCYFSSQNPEGGK